jgi:hypothetical protein
MNLKASVPGHSGIPGNEEADRESHLAQDVSANNVIERPFTSASNTARRISAGRSADKAIWEVDKCNKQFSYGLKGETRTKRSGPLAGFMLLTTWFYRLQCWHAPSGVYLKLVSHREDNIFWWCEGTAVQTREHLFCHAAGGETSRKHTGRRLQR